MAAVRRVSYDEREIAYHITVVKERASDFLQQPLRSSASAHLRSSHDVLMAKAVRTRRRPCRHVNR